jgi:hypothetical protein
MEDYDPATGSIGPRSGERPRVASRSTVRELASVGVRRVSTGSALAAIAYQAPCETPGVGCWTTAPCHLGETASIAI